MKGYKASIKGKCRDQVYEVGKTYKMEFVSEGEIELCYRGFHFCQNPNDVFEYYEPIDNNIVLFEVEALGKIKHDNEKSVTDEIKISSEIPKEEYNSLFTEYEFKHDSNDNLIWLKDFDGDIWEFKYDSNNNLIWKKEFDDYISIYKYDSNNNLIMVKTPNGYIIEYKYDENNNLIWKNDYDGYIWEFKYDSNNNLIWEKCSYNKTLSNYSYNNIWEYKYDKYNNLIWKKDKFDNIKEYPSYKVTCY